MWIAGSGKLHPEVAALLANSNLISADEIADILGQSSPQKLTKRVLPLEPPAVEPLMWPFLGLHLNFHQKVPSVQLILILCGLVGKTLQHVMLRFENPSGRAHNFYHAQFTRGMFNTGLVHPAHVICPNCNHHFSAGHALEWMSLTQPSIALDAFNAISLAMCLLMSLYGAKFLRQSYAIEAPLERNVTHMFCGGRQALAHPISLIKDDKRSWFISV